MDWRAAAVVLWAFAAGWLLGSAEDIRGVTVALAALWAGLEAAAWAGLLGRRP
jgi:hypothetical protein